MLSWRQGDGWTDHPEPLLTPYPYILPREWPWPGPDVVGRTPRLPTFLSAPVDWVIGQLISLGLSFIQGSEICSFSRNLGLPRWHSSKKSAYQFRRSKRHGLISELGWSSGEGNGNPFQYSCLKNPMDRGAWEATTHKGTKSWTWLNDCPMRKKKIK